MINTIIITGRLTINPEWKESIKLCRFGIASSSCCKDKDGKYITNYFWCSAFNKIGESITKNARKGMLVAIEGSMEMRRYHNKNTGVNYENYYINVNTIQFLEKMNNTNEVINETNIDLPEPTLEENDLPSDIEDTLPF